jgi:ABC-2 type transport system permease protein/capsular polysaccharide transport system permease protein
VHKLWHPVSYLMFPLSGAAFLLSALPLQAQHILIYLPMISGTEFLREGFFGSKIHAIYDMQYMMECNLVLTMLGLAILRKVSDEVIPA